MNPEGIFIKFNQPVVSFIEIFCLLSIQYWTKVFRWKKTETYMDFDLNIDFLIKPLTYALCRLNCLHTLSSSKSISFHRSFSLTICLVRSILYSSLHGINSLFFWIVTSDIKTSICFIKAFCLKIIIVDFDVVIKSYMQLRCFFLCRAHVP